MMIGVLVLAVALGIATETDRVQIWLPAAATTLALTGVAVALYTRASRHRPAALVVSRRERAFVAPPSAPPVFQAAAFTLLGGPLVGDKVADVISREYLWPVDAALGATWVLLVAVQWHVAAGRHGLRLRPDGVLNRQALGSHFIPWDAFDPALPLAAVGHGLAASYHRPDLVRRRGLGGGRRTLPADVDPEYLIRVVHEYVNHPEHRTAVGSEAELHRVGAATGS
ncbi:hypothetical protein BG844_08725 [Couchioplanes caeruleus subsp. caeruleus]|uniref:PH (Pleckstrin Homology) domain-containing protein n=1 Tax=Couchioplanes caeruleus subsp. caeruleus TaxID=56427 RepID=A0A1K0GQE4_9ACTN|nr:hypothetical protein BG844_08725 [Couchioplanes caeruleus subsp. caeruleus]